MATTYTGEYKHRETQTSMPPMGFEPMTSTSERTNICRSLDCAVIVIGSTLFLSIINRLIFAIDFPWRRKQNVIIKYDGPVGIVRDISIGDQTSPFIAL
jgi:hypothetical protein